MEGRVRCRVLVLDDNPLEVTDPVRMALGPHLEGGADIPALDQIADKESSAVPLTGILEGNVELTFCATVAEDDKRPSKVVRKISSGAFVGCFDLVLLDDNWEGEEFGGQDLLLPVVYECIKGVSGDLPIICLFTKHWSAERILRFNRRVQEVCGCWKRIVICQKGDSLQLLNVFQRAINAKKLVLDKAAEEQKATTAVQRARVHGVDVERPLRAESAFRGMLGESVAMREVFDSIRMVDQTSTTVLITGETGTGKELVARAIHLGSRRLGRWVPVEISNIAPTLIEGELFGHVKGAFNDARDRNGLVKSAHKGTLFLDEIGDLPLEMQVKLLRMLQERQIRHVGSDDFEDVNVRVIAATHRDLEALVKQGKFREDLYWRLNVFNIWMPPLRERRGDIPLLTDRFIQEHCRNCSKTPLVLEPKVMPILMAYDWPGNVRQLDHAIESAVVRCGGQVVLAEHLPECVRRPKSATTPIANGVNAHKKIEIERRLDVILALASEGKPRITNKMVDEAMERGSGAALKNYWRQNRDDVVKVVKANLHKYRSLVPILQRMSPQNFARAFPEVEGA